MIMTEKNSFRKINYLKDKKVVNAQSDRGSSDNNSKSTLHPLLRTAKQIKWLRERSPAKLQVDSINKYYEYKDEVGKKIIIKPEYLFSATKFNQIAELRNLFAEFDKDKSKTLELSEMKEMFITNNIPLKMEDLFDLFFKGSGTETRNKFHLDFSDLVNYAISNSTDEKYRKFMRKLRETIANQKSSDDTLYLPMNFNLLLEYFNDKGKIRENITSVEETIKNIEKMTFKDIKLKSLLQLEQERKLHSTISFSSVVENFKDVLKISSEKLQRMEAKKEKNKLMSILKEYEKYDSNPARVKYTRRRSLSKLPEVSNNYYSTAKITADTHCDSNCPKNMNSFYDFVSNISSFNSSIKKPHHNKSKSTISFQSSKYSIQSVKSSLYSVKTRNFVNNFKDNVSAISLPGLLKQKNFSS